MNILLMWALMALATVATRADEVTAFSGGDGTTFDVVVPSVVIANGQKAADNTSWTVSIYNSSGASFGTTANFIGAGVQSDRPVTLVVLLSQPGIYSISGTPEDGDVFSGTVIPTTDLADQSSVDAINSALTTIQQQVGQNTTDISSLQSLNSTLQAQITTLQNDTATLQGQVIALQNDSTNSQESLVDIQSQIDSLDNQIATQQANIATLENLQTEVTALENTPAPVIPKSSKWLSAANYLIIGGAAVGATGLGIGAYALFFDHSSSPAATTLSAPPSNTEVPDTYEDERLYSPAK